MTIKLKDIIPAPWNTRGEITPESVKELSESIKEQGLINPITVWMDEDGSGWYCIAGHRRLAALRSIGADETECIEFKGTANDAKMVTVTENLQRESVDALNEAKVIAELGEDAEIVASKLGKTATWVRRRNKLNALCGEMRECVGKVTLESLERISDLTQDQQQKMAKNIANKSKWYGGILKWNDLKRDAEALTADLDAAFFDTAECAKCSDRTGADWFADESAGKLGRCLNCKCYKAKAKAWEEAKIAEAIGDAESVKVDHEWQMPHEARQDMGDKRTKKHPCAWYWFDAGELIVKWAKPKKQIEVEKKAKDAAYEAEQKEHRAERDKIDAITEKLDAWANSDDDESKSPAGLDVVVAKIIAKSCDVVCRDYAIQAVAEKIANWHDGKEWAEVIRAFPAVIKLANITDEERDCLLSKYPIENENE